MNEQAAVLQQMVQRLRPGQRRPAIHWLLHSCTPGLDLAGMANACETVLAELGWETVALMAGRLQCSLPQDTRQDTRQDTVREMLQNTVPTSPVPTSPVPTGPVPRPKAFVAYTDSPEIQMSRLPGTAAIIFVLDTTPTSLINTYRQIKTLIGQRQDLGSHIGLLFVPPNGSGRRRLQLSCERFLNILPTDLGVVTRWQGGTSEGPKQGLLGDRELATLPAWRQVVRRGLCGL